MRKTFTSFLISRSSLWATLLFAFLSLQASAQTGNVLTYEQPAHGHMIVQQMGDEGTIDIKSGDVVNVPENTALVVTVTVDEGYTVKRIYLNEGTAPEDDVMFDKSPENDKAFVGFFMWPKVSTKLTAIVVKADDPSVKSVLTYDQPAHGSMIVQQLGDEGTIDIKSGDVVNVPENTALVVTVTVEEGYTVKRIYLNEGTAPEDDVMFDKSPENDKAFVGFFTWPNKSTKLTAIIEKSGGDTPQAPVIIFEQPEHAKMTVTLALESGATPVQSGDKVNCPDQTGVAVNVTVDEGYKLTRLFLNDGTKPDDEVMFDALPEKPREYLGLFMWQNKTVQITAVVEPDKTAIQAPQQNKNAYEVQGMVLKTNGNKATAVALYDLTGRCLLQGNAATFVVDLAQYAPQKLFLLRVGNKAFKILIP